MKAKKLYLSDDYEITEIPGHQGGRNQVYICQRNEIPEYILRISASGDRKREDYLAEAEFIRFLADKGAPVADVLPSAEGNYVESCIQDDKEIFVMLFSYAPGMLLSDNGYRYREGVSLDEYFYNTGKALGAIHRLSKIYQPVHRRFSFEEKYTSEYIDELIPDTFSELKDAIKYRLALFSELPKDQESYGLIHFDFSDGNYHVDLNNGNITVFDFDNCIYCWYMFDLAHLWTHGVGWYQFERDPAKRMQGMGHYFDAVLEGYRSETDVSEELLEKLPLFIDMTLIEFITDEFECCAREGEEVDYEDIEDAARCLIESIPYAGFGQ